MKFKDNKRYRLFNYNTGWGNLYVKKKDGLIHVYYQKYYSEEETTSEYLWIESSYTDCRMIYRSNSEDYEITQYGSKRLIDFCYMVFKKFNGKACIIEVVSKNVILDDIEYDCKLILRNKNKDSNKDFCYMLLKEKDGKAYIMDIFSKIIKLKDIYYKSVKSIEKRTIHCENCWTKDEAELADALLSIDNEKDQLYSIFSIKEGFIFGPQKYEWIEELNYGVILDDHIAIEKDGYVFDFEKYERNGMLYFNKDKNDYKLLLDLEDGIFFTMEEDCIYSEIVKYEFENVYGKVTYTYNKESGELREELERDSGGYQWTERETWDAITDGQYGDYPEEGGATDYI